MLPQLIFIWLRIIKFIEADEVFDDEGRHGMLLKVQFYCSNFSIKRKLKTARLDHNQNWNLLLVFALKFTPNKWIKQFYCSNFIIKQMLKTARLDHNQNWNLLLFFALKFTSNKWIKRHRHDIHYPDTSVFIIRCISWLVYVFCGDLVSRILFIIQDDRLFYAHKIGSGTKGIVYLPCGDFSPVNVDVNVPCLTEVTGCNVTQNRWRYKGCIVLPRW